MKTRLLSTTAAVGLALALTLGAADVQAAPITGSVGFTGEYTPLDNGASQSNLDADTDAFQIDYAEVQTLSPDYDSFGAVGDNTTAGTLTFNDFQFDPDPGAFTLFTLSGGLSFQSDVITSINKDVVGPTRSIAVEGTGSVSAPGRETTPGFWVFTANEVNGAEFTFSSSAGSTAVPEPATLGLLGVSLMGLGWAARRRKHAA